MTPLIDTHIHLDLLADPAEQLAEAATAGVGSWLVPGVTPEKWPEILSLAERFSGVYAAPGVHPEAAAACDGAALDRLRIHLAHPRAIAIGEVGLDRQVNTPWPDQEKTFVAMVQLACATGKPLLIHCRKGLDRVLELLRRERAQRVGGIFHAFSGSLETARILLDCGFLLGIGGALTWSSARRLPEVVRAVPAEALVLESDAPFMTPTPYRGQANRAAWLRLVAEQVATLRGWSLEETAQVTTANAQRILQL